MNSRNPMLTLSQIMAKLAERGVTQEFRMNEKGEMKLNSEEYSFSPEELTILRSYRFEGESNPEDNAVLYLIKSNHNEVGYIIDSYGAESNYPGDSFDDFIRKIPVENHAEWDFETTESNNH